MKSGTWIRLLGAGIIVLALSGLVQQSVAIANMKPYMLERPGMGWFWFTSAVSALLNLASIWAGFALPSRRPSRRREVGIIFALTALFRVYAIANWFVSIRSLRFIVSVLSLMPVWAPTSILDLILLACALVHLFRTRSDPDCLPRRSVTPIGVAPPGTHRTVAPEIVDGPNWREALLASLHETGAQETPRRRAWPWVIALILVTAVGRAVFYALDQVVGVLPLVWQALVWLVAMFVSLAALGLPLAAIRSRMLQARQRSAEQALRKAGAQRPIFYLRSFALDEEVGGPSVLELFLNIQPANPEQTMTQVLRRSGPVIAIGRPGEQLPALGAARFYVSHELWQEKVADVATVARLVVWASGVTPGLQWEITHLVRSLAPEKLVLWAHPHLLDLDADEREAQWASFVDGLGGLFPKPLPKPLGATRFFAFDKDFTPIRYGSRGWKWQGALAASLRALLTAKDVPPYDKASVARRTLIRRIVLGVVGAVLAFVLAGASYLARQYYGPGAPSPLGWNLLGSDLFDAEVFVDPPDANKTLEGLRQTVGELGGGWRRGDWHGVPPGRLPPLERAAEHYLAAFDAAHADAAIEGAFYATRTYLVFDAHSAPEAQALSQKLASVRVALGVADQDWAAIKAETTGWFYANKIRAVVAAREHLLDAEKALLDLLATNPTAWTTDKGANGAPTLHFSDDNVLTQARALAAQRDAAATALATAFSSK